MRIMMRGFALILMSAFLWVSALGQKATPTPTPENDDERAIREVSERMVADGRAAQKLLDEANSLIAQGKNQEALIKLDQARALDANNTRILAAGAIALMNLGQLDRAEQVATLGVNSFFSGREIYDALGQVQYAKRNLAAAVTSYSKAIEKDDGYSPAYYHRGIARAESGDDQGAIADYTAAIKLDPRLDDAYFKRGYLYIFVLNEPAKGIADYDSFIAINPNESYSYSNRASGYFNLKQFDRSLADNTKAIQIWDKNKFAFANRGLVYAQQGKYDLARADYAKALAIDPKFQLAKDRLADIDKAGKSGAEKKEETRSLINGILDKPLVLTPDMVNGVKKKTDGPAGQGNDPATAIPADPARRVRWLNLHKRHDEALALANETLAREPSNEAMLRQRAETYSYLGKLDLQKADVDKLFTMSSSAANLAARGDWEFRKQMYPEAKADFQKSLELDPGNADVIATYGMLLAAQNDPNGALAQYDKAIQIDPENAIARSNRPNVYLNYFDRPADAITDINIAMKSVAKSEELYYMRGVAKFKLNDLDGAIADFERAFGLDPNYTDAVNNIGVAYAKKKNLPMALIAYLNAFEIDHTNQVVRDNFYAMIDRVSAGVADGSIKLTPHEEKEWLLARYRRFEYTVKPIKDEADTVISNSREGSMECKWVQPAYVEYNNFKPYLIELRRAIAAHPEEYSEKERAVAVEIENGVNRVLSSLADRLTRGGCSVPQ